MPQLSIESCGFFILDNNPLLRLPVGRQAQDVTRQTCTEPAEVVGRQLGVHGGLPLEFYVRYRSVINPKVKEFKTRR